MRAVTVKGVSFAIFCRRDALFVFEHLAKIRRGIEAALHGDLGEVPLSVLDHTARLADLDGVQVRDQRNAQILIEDAAQVVLRDIEMLGDLLNIRELIVVFVDILDAFGMHLMEFRLFHHNWLVLCMGGRCDLFRCRYPRYS